jgi:very-short-patch-repair endonuclease
MTEPEIWLWARLKRLHARGFQFRRQRPFRGYYLDFACIDRLLVVELDGAHHNEPLQAEHDGIRDAVLRRAGYQVMRFPNSAVRTNIDGVMDAIVLALEARPSVRASGSSGGPRRACT